MPAVEGVTGPTYSSRGMVRMGLIECYHIPLSTIPDARGRLTVVQQDEHVPFVIRRIYYVYGVAQGAARGGHAHRKLQQVFIALAGSFNLVLDDGSRRVSLVLDSPERGYYVAPMLWRELDNFSPGAICLVLASDVYSASDYIREYAQFVTARGANES